MSPATTAGTGARALQRSWLPWLPMALVLVLALAIGSFGDRPPANDDDRLFAIASTMQCTVCNGETVAESNNPSSLTVREEIARQIREGRSDDEITGFLTRQYPGFQLTPPAEGVAGLVWALPVIALVLSLAGLAWAFRRWSRPVDHRATAADRELVERALAQAHGGSRNTDDAGAGA